MSFDRDLYMRAWWFAAERHAGQTVPGTELPYVVHVGAVAIEVIATVTAEAVDDPNLAVACALLHDTIEDTGVSLAEIASAFGAAVAAGVAALSKDGSLPKHEKMGDSLRRIKLQPREVAIVKLADRVVNHGAAARALAERQAPCVSGRGARHPRRARRGLPAASPRACATRSPATTRTCRREPPSGLDVASGHFMARSCIKSFDGMLMP